VICNIDPKKAAKMIGESQFSKTVRRKLDYTYSAPTTWLIVWSKIST
jgi:all-trans-retinol 13,14-reductase